MSYTCDSFAIFLQYFPGKPEIKQLSDG